MVPDEVSIFNLALNAVGARNNLSATTEKDRGAEVCRLWYPVVRDQVLRAAPWPSCKSFQRLALRKTRENEKWVTGDPEPGYSYVYGSPSDMLYPRYLSDFSRFTISSYPVDNTSVVNTNSVEAILTYTRRNYQVSTWEASLQMGIVYGLAANIVMPLSGKPSRAQSLVQQANDLIMGAREQAANSDQERIETIPDWFVARGYANPRDDRFFYPVDTLLTVAGLK